MSYQTISKTLAISFLLAFLSFGKTMAETKILMVGDSITQGGNKTNEYTYRYSLFKLLVDGQTCFDFIGTKTEPHRKIFTWPTYHGLPFDKHHQAYYGIKTADLLLRLQESLPSIEPPDIVLLHIGTNDRKTDNIIKDFKLPLWHIIELLHQKSSDSQIYISLLNQKYDKKIKKIRTLIQDAVHHYNDKGYKIYAVDHSKDWKERPKKPNSDTIDWVHPNLFGQNKMAKDWYQAIVKNYEFKNECKRF